MIVRYVNMYVFYFIVQSKLFFNQIIEFVTISEAFTNSVLLAVSALIILQGNKTLLPKTLGIKTLLQMYVSSIILSKERNLHLHTHHHTSTFRVLRSK